MDSYNISLTTKYSDLDSISRTTIHLPRLVSAEGFPEWKSIFEYFVKIKDGKLWNSIVNGPTMITRVLDDEAHTVVDKRADEYTDADIAIIENDDRALAILFRALSPDIAQRFRAYTSAKALWEALIEVYAVKTEDGEKANVPEKQMKDIQCAPSIFSEVNEIACSDLCLARMKSYIEQVENLHRMVEHHRAESYELKKGQKPLKNKMDTALGDFRKLYKDHTELSIQYSDALKEIACLTAELDTLKSKFQNADFNFKKFDVSSVVVESMIEKQLKFKDQKTEGLGYGSVPPPFNDNYVPNLKPESEAQLEYYDQLLIGNITPETSDTTEEAKVDADLNVSNASTSCADANLVSEAGNQENPKDSNSVPSAVSDNSMKNNVKTVESVPSRTRGRKNKHKNKNKYSKPVEFVKEGECFPEPTPTSNTFSCDCGKFHGPGQSPSFYLKKQTCFNCGIAGHIARNCPYRPYVPYYAEKGENVSRGRSSKRNPSQSRSDGDWNAHKDKRAKTQIHKDNQAKTKMVRPKDLERENVILQLISQLLFDKRAKKQTPKDRRNKKVDSRDNLTKPNSVKSKSSQGSSSNSHLKNKPKAKGGPNSNSSVETPIRSNSNVHNLHKANYRWVPKVLDPKFANIPDAFSFLSDKQDMSWERVKCLDDDGKPSFKMDWVPITN